MTLILLRGLMRDSRHWNGLAQRLESCGHKVITPDTLGNGNLSTASSPLNIEQYGESVWQQVNQALARKGQYSRQNALPQSGQQQTHERVILVGLSMGGMVALAMAKQFPQRVLHLFIINSSAANLSPWYLRFQFKPLMKALWQCQKGTNDQGQSLNLLESLVIRYTSLHRGDDVELIARWSEWRKQHHTSLLNGFRQLLACARFKAPELHELTEVAISVVSGKQDRLANPLCSEVLGEFYGCSVESMDHCGHDISLDQPQALIELLQALTRISQQGD